MPSGLLLFLDLVHVVLPGLPLPLLPLCLRLDPCPHQLVDGDHAPQVLLVRAIVEDEFPYVVTSPVTLNLGQKTANVLHSTCIHTYMHSLHVHVHACTCMYMYTYHACTCACTL